MDQFDEQRLWLFNAALRNALGLKNPHEPIVIDENSRYVEYRFVNVSYDIKEQGVEKIWNEYNPLKKRMDYINAYEANIGVLFNYPENLYNVMLQEFSPTSDEHASIRKSTDIPETIELFLDNEEVVAQSRFLTKLQRTKNSIIEKKEECEEIKQHPIFIDCQNLMEEVRKKGLFQPAA